MFNIQKLAAAILGTIISYTTIETANPLNSEAFVIFNRVGNTLEGGSRWDAAPRIINGNERSLDGGLRYSLQGGSYEAFRDLFTWDVIPSISNFQNSIETAFNAWTVVDPVSKLGTDLTFFPDLGTPVLGTGNGGVNSNGAEIDLLASQDAFFWNPGDSGARGETFFNDIFDTVTLTSKTANYTGSRAISGADITLNNNPETVYSLDIFRRLLTHEIGHALGLGDVEGDINPGGFIDDNYDGTSSATALATLTNPIAQLIDPLNPANSPFSLFTVPDTDPGISTIGVNILMESRGLGISEGNPLSNLTPLINDDYAGRQFLYPVVARVSVSEPATILGTSLTFGLGILLTKRKKIKSQKSTL
ncbi:hypothetical protein DSM106972_038630 [Dulcicalothrix desertica PCC 7102]|uniref:Uncharacterized protein n=1 Tax=Dulcicalothrix desertica PCC 7102 TaxID=232991 RepID=A0A433VG26_9CYAN|nr:hypothetical protein [Dulcicalothrix desertica]RUT05042.1 hypothetical protein DSM106972_038630 [Dulcicalothrix desertica PCC 7102]TWH62583.1 putative secreted protein with PEP-CTERM sorting signal [Dulcicalothrix desertica PCC 7102]